MTSFTFRMPAGIPGEVNRLWAGTTIEPNIQETPFFLNYGLAAVMDTSTGAVRPPASGDTSIYGFVCRPFPFQAGAASGQYGSQPLGTVVAPPQAGVIDIMRRGYITVLLGGSTAAVKGGQVYVWITASTGAHVLGQVEAAASSGNTLAPANSTFNGPADSSGNVEIGFNI